MVAFALSAHLVYLPGNPVSVANNFIFTLANCCLKFAYLLTYAIHIYCCYTNWN